MVITTPGYKKNKQGTSGFYRAMAAGTATSVPKAPKKWLKGVEARV